MKKQELSDLRHNVNNPLAIIKGYTLVMKKTTTDIETLKMLEKISIGADRIAIYLKQINKESTSWTQRLSLVSVLFCCLLFI
jgi:signal transduction histidine kinase